MGNNQSSIRFLPQRQTSLYHCDHPFSTFAMDADEFQSSTDATIVTTSVSGGDADGSLVHSSHISGGDDVNPTAITSPRPACRRCRKQKVHRSALSDLMLQSSDADCSTLELRSYVVHEISLAARDAETLLPFANIRSLQTENCWHPKD